MLLAAHPAVVAFPLASVHSSVPTPEMLPASRTVPLFPLTPLSIAPLSLRTLPAAVSIVLWVSTSVVSRPTSTSLESCSVQVRSPVAAPVTLKWFVAAAVDIPARYTFPSGSVPDPRSHSAADPGTSAPPAAGTVRVHDPESRPDNVTLPDSPLPTAFRAPLASTCHPTPFASACHGIACDPVAVVNRASRPVPLLS